MDFRNVRRSQRFENAPDGQAALSLKYWRLLLAVLTIADVPVPQDYSGFTQKTCAFSDGKTELLSNLPSDQSNFSTAFWSRLIHFHTRLAVTPALRYAARSPSSRGPLYLRGRARRLGTAVLTPGRLSGCQLARLTNEYPPTMKIGG